MKTKLAVVAVVSWALAVAASPAVGDLKTAPGRDDVVEIDGPVLVSRDVLTQEMRLNSGLRRYIGLYGWPDYVEVQEIVPEWPWAAYETRLYYVRREKYLAFGRVNVAPNVKDYGLEKFEGKLDAETMNRLLTAKPGAPVKSEGVYGEEILPTASAEY